MAGNNRLLADNQDFGSYRVVSLLGRGGMGEVYRVQHKVLQQEYAVKMLRSDFTDRIGRERFEEEARIMAGLGQSSPYIVKVDDFGNTDNSYWLCMELANGFSGAVTLADLMLNAEGQQVAVNPELFRILFFQILSAMAEAHKTVVHRDLKPSNILLFTDRDGNAAARVSDFGLVSIVGEKSFVEHSHKSMQRSLSFDTDKSTGDSSGSGKSAEGLVGTWEYLSPEQQDRQPATVQSDIYSLGLIAFKVLTGKKKPWFRLPSKQVKGLPKFWDDLVMMALEESLDERFSSVEEMLDLMLSASGSSAASDRLQAEKGAEQKNEEVLRRGMVKTFDGIEFVFIEPGEFNMGSNDYDDEKPVHRVKISAGFWLGKYPVTQGQWQAVMGNNQSYFKNGDNYPVECVSWNDIQGFIKRLNKSSASCGKELDSEQVWEQNIGGCYRLPTEAEWEYAARAGTNTEYSWGDNAACDKANYGNSSYSSECKGSNPSKTSAVGTYPVNTWGLYDMQGNVWEWVLDWFDSSYYGKCGGVCTDPANLEKGSYRVVRGGGWGNCAEDLRSANRFGFGSGGRNDLLGFRLVRSVRRQPL